jgi:hypothetical protein
MNRKSVFLTSQLGQKLNGTKNSYVKFVLENNISFSPYEDITLQIQNVVLPISSYLINENNDLLVFNGTPYLLQHGNYSVADLITEIQGEILNLTITFNRKTNKFLFSYTAPFTIDSSSTILGILGLSNMNHVSVSNAVESDDVIDLSGNNMFYIGVEEIQTNNILQSKVSSIIGSIPVDSNYGDILVSSYQIPSRVYINSLSILTVFILDENLNYVNFQNKEWNITLLFESQINIDNFNKYLYLQNIISS